MAKTLCTGCEGSWYKGCVPTSHGVITSPLQMGMPNQHAMMPPNMLHHGGGGGAWYTLAWGVGGMVPHQNMVRGQMQIGPHQHPAGHPTMHGHHMLAYQTSHGGGGGGGGGAGEEGRELGGGGGGGAGERSRGRERVRYRAVRGTGRKGVCGECTGREGVARLSTTIRWRDNIMEKSLIASS